jgi:homogentisate 1,2-dioxygenase
MSGHGPDRPTYEKATHDKLAPVKQEGTLAFMWESRYVFRPTRAAMGAKQLQKDYDKAWSGF